LAIRNKVQTPHPNTKKGNERKKGKKKGMKDGMTERKRKEGEFPKLSHVRRSFKTH
jgi:hypothetical protein